MKTQLRRYRPWNLTADEVQQVSHLNYQETGWMQRDLRDCRTRGTDSWVYYICDENDVILSWALVELKGKLLPSAQFWTRRGYRRAGYGTRLYNKVVRDLGRKPKVYPHNRVSIDFFRKVGNRSKRLW